MGLFSGITKAIGGVLGGVSKAVSPVLPLITGGLSYLGQQQTNEANSAQAANQMAFQAASTKEQMDFQERMRETQYQTAVKDMQSAGLSPMLAYSQGGAGNLSGASASGAMARMENSAASASQSALSAAQLGLIKAQTDTAESQAELNSASADKVRSEAGLTGINLQRESKLFQIFGTLEGERLTEANIAKAIRDKYFHSRDSTSMRYLDEFAGKYGYRSMPEALGSQEFRQNLLDFARGVQTKNLQGFEFNRARAESDFYGSSTGKYLAPYLGTAKDVVGIGSTIRNAKPR